jgi:hypothetical protein
MLVWCKRLGRAALSLIATMATGRVLLIAPSELRAQQQVDVLDACVHSQSGGRGRQTQSLTNVA